MHLSPLHYFFTINNWDCVLFGTRASLLAGHYYNMSIKINSILGHIFHLFVKNTGYNFLVKGWSLHEQTTKTNYHVAASEVNTYPVQADLCSTAAGIFSKAL